MHGTTAEYFVRVYDGILHEQHRNTLSEYLNGTTDKAGWRFGWKSQAKNDTYSFWHRHFAGYHKSEEQTDAFDCEPLVKEFPLIYEFWKYLEARSLKGHRLIRCYANGYTYGCDGTLHTDTEQPNTFTTIYYPHYGWDPNWGGETVFFNYDKSDVIGCVYPKPNRMVTFDGRIPHVARGVSRTCPLLRVTLMFKTDTPDDTERDRDVPA